MALEPICKIIRLEQTEEGALGALLLFGHYFCSTLEPDNEDSVRFQIPEGTWYCKKFKGVKYKNTYEVVIPDHTALLFHPGNLEEDTTGCILLGQYPSKLKGDRAVLNSGVTFQKFIAILRGIEWFYTKIVNYY